MRTALVLARMLAAPSYQMYDDMQGLWIPVTHL